MEADFIMALAVAKKYVQLLSVKCFFMLSVGVSFVDISPTMASETAGLVR